MLFPFEHMGFLGGCCFVSLQSKQKQAKRQRNKETRKQTNKQTRKQTNKKKQTKSNTQHTPTHKQRKTTRKHTNTQTHKHTHKKKRRKTMHHVVILCPLLSHHIARMKTYCTSQREMMHGLATGLWRQACKFCNSHVLLQAPKGYPQHRPDIHSAAKRLPKLRQTPEVKSGCGESRCIQPLGLWTSAIFLSNRRRPAGWSSTSLDA